MVVSVAQVTVAIEIASVAAVVAAMSVATARFAPRATLVASALCVSGPMGNPFLMSRGRRAKPVRRVLLAISARRAATAVSVAHDRPA